jgi:hypothetical protein
MGDQPGLMRVGGDVAALTNALAGLDAVQIEAQSAALAQFLASTAQAADLARLSLETVKAKAGATAEQIDQADLAFKSAVAAARAAAAEGRIISRLIKARQATLGAEAKEARRDDPAERTWSELSERFLAIAKDGGRVPTTADEAGSELHAATVRIRRIKPRKTNHQAIWEALERLTLEWPEPIRPTMALCAREASFATDADESLPAAEGAAARRKGRKQAGDQERGDREPPSQAALLTGEDDYHADAAEYRALVRAWMAWVSRQDLRPDANCGWLQAGQAADTGTDQLRTEFVHQHQLRHARLRREDVAGCVDATVRAWRDERGLEILAGILGRPSTDEGRAELRRMITSWTSAEPLPRPEDEAARHELYVAVIAHWMWQIKKRAAGLPVEWDLMPVLVGPQGSGKTSVVDKLCSVLAELSVPVTAVQIVDQREAPLMARALAGRWDEMSGASRADGDALKRAISQAQAAFRRLYSNDFEVRRRCITFIGSSNFNLSVILSDTSGARRFAEIFVRQVDWDLFNELDMALVWQAVSQNDPPPILEQMGALQAHQATIVPRDLLRVWLEREADGGFPALRIFRQDGEPTIIPALDPEEPKPGDQCDRPGGWTLDQIAQRVASFGRAFGRGAVQIERLGQRLRELGWDERQVRVGARSIGRRERRWYLDPKVRQQLSPRDPEAKPTDAAPAEVPHGPF